MRGLITNDLKRWVRTMRGVTSFETRRWATESLEQGPLSAARLPLGA